MRLAMALAVLAMIMSAGCVGSGPGPQNGTSTTANGAPTTVAGFCGRSTGGSYSSDTDCTTGGCSGQVCQSKSEEGAVTTCEYAECYDAAKYGLSCKCQGGGCRWA